MLDVKSAATRLGVSASLLYQMVSRREVPHFRIGSKILFDEADLHAYREGCRVGAVGKTHPARTPSVGAFTQLDPARLAKAWKEQGVL